MGVDATLWNGMVRQILALVAPGWKIAFGSAATGQMVKDREIELSMVGPPPAQRHEASIQTSRSARHQGTFSCRLT